jgi:hypothetical protein
MICARKQGNVVTIFTNIATGQPYEITSFDDLGPPDAFPVAMSVQEAQAKYGINNIKFFEAQKTPVGMVPGVEATDADVSKFMNENLDPLAQHASNLVQEDFRVKLVQPRLEEKLAQAPGFIDTEFIDACTKRAIQNEIETYELAERFASPKKLKEIKIIINALKEFMDRIENGKSKEQK